MTSSLEHVSTLVELGLSQSQAKVYLALFKSKNPTARIISKISGISRPDVYRVLGTLKDAGLVEKIISKPEKFHAVPIEEIVSTLLERRKRKTQQLQKQALRLAKALKGQISRQELDDECGFILISGKEAVYAKAEKMIRSVQECVCCLEFPIRVRAWFSICSPNLKEALARNVRCRMIMPKPEEDFGDSLKSLEKHPKFSLRTILEKPETAFSVWDRQEILIDTSAMDTAAPAPLLWSNNKSIVTLCQEYFEYMWLKAGKAEFKV